MSTRLIRSLALVVALLLAPVAALASGKDGATASSTLKKSKVANYEAANVFDGDPSTAWCEAAPGDGVGQWVEIPLGAGEQLTPLHEIGVELRLGFQRDRNSFANNGMPTRVRVELRRKGEAIGSAEAACGAICNVDLEGPPKASGPLSLRLTVLEAKTGAKWSDTCVSEILPTFVEVAAQGANAAAERFCKALTARDAASLKDFTGEALEKLRDTFTSELGDAEDPVCNMVEVRSAGIFDLRLPRMDGDGSQEYFRFTFDGKKWRAVKATTYAPF